MLKILLVTLALNCPIPEVENYSDEPWNDKDQKSYEKAINRCAEKYERSPCLTRFHKTKPLTYWIICGAPQPTVVRNYK